MSAACCECCDTEDFEHRRLGLHHHEYECDEFHDEEEEK